jgi:hypothetical protein
METKLQNVCIRQNLLCRNARRRESGQNKHVFPKGYFPNKTADIRDCRKISHVSGDVRTQKFRKGDMKGNLLTGDSESGENKRRPRNTETFEKEETWQ